VTPLVKPVTWTGVFEFARDGAQFHRPDTAGHADKPMRQARGGGQVSLCSALFGLGQMVGGLGKKQRDELRDRWLDAMRSTLELRHRSQRAAVSVHGLRGDQLHAVGFEEGAQRFD